MSVLKKILRKIFFPVKYICNFTGYIMHIIYRYARKPENYKVIFKDNGEVYGGYYDICLHDGNEEFLCHIRENNSAHWQVGFIELDGRLRKSAGVCCVSEQMGSRATLKDLNGERVVAFNRSNDYGKSTWSIFDRNLTFKYEFPFQCYDWIDGSFGLVICELNFYKLEHFRPGYGYSSNTECVQDTLLGIIHVVSNKGYHKHQIFPIDLKKLLSTKWQYAEIYLNHFSVSPNGERVIFIVLSNSFERRISSLFAYDVRHRKIYLISESSPVSHYSWRDGSSLLYYGYNNYYNEIGLNLVRFDALNFEIDFIIKIHDGHPSFFPNKDYIIYDDYANVFGLQRLYVVNIREKSISELFRSYRPIFKNNKDRVDFHPRVITDRQSVLIDDLFDGRRVMVEIDLRHHSELWINNI